MRPSASRSNAATIIGLVMVAAVAGALIHAGLPRERTDAATRRALQSQQTLARTLAGNQAMQEAYGMTSSVVTYLLSLGAFGPTPPPSLASYTVGAAAVRTQSRDVRVDVLTSIAGPLAERARTLRELRLADPAMRRALAPVPTATLEALRVGPVRLDPAVYAPGLAEMQRAVTSGQQETAGAAHILVQSHLDTHVPLAALPLAAGIASLLLACVLSALVLRSSRRDRSMRVDAATDSLTGAANRRRLEHDLDLDNFKQLNDRSGHAAGDEALRRVAAAVAACLRRQDVLYRYGGEEFCVLLADTTAEEAAVVAERIRAVVEAVPVPGEEALPGGRLTASIGVAAGATARAGLETADALLYVAKTDGRNRVCV